MVNVIQYYFRHVIRGTEPNFQPCTYFMVWTSIIPRRSDCSVVSLLSELRFDQIAFFKQDIESTEATVALAGGYIGN